MKRHQKIAGATSLMTVMALVGSIFPTSVYADSAAALTEFTDCIASTEETTCTLSDDITLSSSVSITQNKTIDLNGHDINSAAGASGTNYDMISVDGATVTVTGTGTVDATGARIPFQIKGSIDSTAVNRSVLNIDKDVTVKSNMYAIWATNAYDSTAKKYHTYGTVLNFAGKVDANYGFYINGSVQDVAENAPIFNIEDGAVINTTGRAVYAAGYGIWNFGQATIDSGEGIGIKAGKLTFNNTTVAVDGDYAEPDPFNNGMNDSGATFQFESNDNYADNVDVTINGGNYSSENGHLFYEYKETAETTNAIQKMTITGGTFTSEKATFQVSDNFTLANFISGGVYDQIIPKNYIGTGYTLYDSAQDEYTVDTNFTLPEQPEQITLSIGQTATINLGDNKYATAAMVSDETASFNGATNTITALAAGENMVTVNNRKAYEDENIDVPIPVYVYNVENTVDDADDTSTTSTTLVIDAKELDENDVDEADIELVEKALAEQSQQLQLSSYFDVTVDLYSNGIRVVDDMSEFVKPIKVTVAAPAGINAGLKEGYTRHFYVVRVHGGASVLLPATYNAGDDTISFESNLFSTYALAYYDVAPVVEEETAPTTPDTGTFTREEVSDKATAVTAVLFASTFAMVALIALAYHTRKNEK